MDVSLTYKVPVSVVTPAHNAARFLPRCIAAVRRQGVECEHIVVDDCSEDNTSELLERLKETNPQLVVLRTPRNCGPMEARNLAVQHAHGRFLAFLDADDVWMPSKLSTQIAFMETHGAALSFTDYRFMSEDGRLVGRRLRGPVRIGWHMHHMTRYLGCLTIMIDRQQCPDFRFPALPREYKAEDFLAWAQLIREHGSAFRCPSDLARYSVVQGSRSSDGLGAARTVWSLYRKIERLPFLQAAFYFSCYAFFTFSKRLLCRPNRMTPVSEKQLFGLPVDY